MNTDPLHINPFFEAYYKKYGRLRLGGFLLYKEQFSFLDFNDRIQNTTSFLHCSKKILNSRNSLIAIILFLQTVPKHLKLKEEYEPRT